MRNALIGVSPRNGKYDAEGRMCAIQNLLAGSITGYLYDAEGTRVAKGNLGSLSCGSEFAVAEQYLLGPGNV